MVPVPEHLVASVLAFLDWKGPPQSRSASDARPHSQRAADEADDGSGGGGPVARAFAAVDDRARSLLAAVATAALDQEMLTLPEAGRRAGLSTREALGTVLQVNLLIAGEGGPPLAVGIKGLEGASAADFDWDNSFVTMQEPIARELAEFVRADAQE
jgi:hypothetical protein